VDRCERTDKATDKVTVNYYEVPYGLEEAVLGHPISVGQRARWTVFDRLIVAHRESCEVEWRADEGTSDSNKKAGA
jgi:hypothetical protein